jgi:hypothetical protein
MSLASASDDFNSLAKERHEVEVDGGSTQAWGGESACSTGNASFHFATPADTVEIDIKKKVLSNVRQIHLFFPIHTTQLMKRILLKSSTISASVRAKRAFRLNNLSQVPYFETKFHSIDSSAPKFSIGLVEPISSEPLQTKLIPGLAQNSFGLFSDGSLYHNNQMFMPPDSSRSFSSGDRVGCGVFIDSYHQWRPFFTISGRCLPMFTFWFMPRVMECFPAVSVMSESTAARFSVDGFFTGPYKFTPNMNFIEDSAPKIDYINELPSELLREIMLLAAPTPVKVSSVLGTINKRWNLESSHNVIWRDLYLKRWPRQNSALDARSWKKIFRRRKEVEVSSAHPTNTEIGTRCCLMDSACHDSKSISFFFLHRKLLL